MLNAFFAMILRDLKHYIKNPFDWIRPILFFVMVVCLFAMLTRLAPKNLAEIAPAILWVALALALIISLENILSHDFEDGSLYELLTSPFPLPILLFGKLLAHWIAVLFALLMVTPILAVAVNLPWIGFKGLMLTLLLGLPTLSLIAALGASLMIGLRQGGTFLALIILPFLLPVLLFGASGTLSASVGLPFVGELAILGALFLSLLVVVPFTMAYVIRISMQ